jgi:hypothetical protein
MHRQPLDACKLTACATRNGEAGRLPHAVSRSHTFVVRREEQGQRRDFLEQHEAQIELVACGELRGIERQGLRRRLRLRGVNTQADGVAEHL